MRDIARATAAHFKLTVEALKGNDLHQQVAAPRMLAMALCRRNTSRSLPEIGRFFNRDHTTVLHACLDMEPHTKRGQSMQAHIDAIMPVAVHMASWRAAVERNLVESLHRGEAVGFFATPARRIDAPPPLPRPKRRRNASWAIPVLVPARHLRERDDLGPSIISRPTKAQLMGRRA